MVLDVDKAERVNHFDPERFQVSDDGTYVTNKETREVFPLTVFFYNDEENGASITFGLDEAEEVLLHARVVPKNKHERGKSQNFHFWVDKDNQGRDKDKDLRVACYDVHHWQEHIFLEWKKQNSIKAQTRNC